MPQKCYHRFMYIAPFSEIFIFQGSIKCISGVNSPRAPAYFFPAPYGHKKTDTCMWDTVYAIYFASLIFRESGL